MRYTKIVATVGPASREPSVLRAMVRAGMDVARLNASHISAGEVGPLVLAVRAAAEAEGRPVAVLLDLAGAKLRTGPTLDESPIRLEPGQTVRLLPGEGPGTAGRLFVSYPRIAEDVLPGHRVLLADGDLELAVDSTDGVGLVCTVVAGGELGSRKGVAFPDSDLALPPLTTNDEATIAAGVGAGVDYLGLSFVPGAAHVRDVKERLTRLGATIPVIAKIERRQAVERLDEILAVADGAMVARGDLGVELPLERVPLEQRRIIQAAGRRLKPVITATQMLESMIRSPRPTRAEASDVANAVWDLSDAVMLSDETAVGRYPVEAVATMDRLVRAAESMPAQEAVPVPDLETDNHSFVIAAAARRMAEYDRNVRAIVCFSTSGATALLLSKVHAPVPVYALTPSEETWRRMALARGVEPILVPWAASSEEMVRMVDDVLTRQGHLDPGDEAIVVASLPLRARGVTNFLKLHRVAESLSLD